MGGQHKHNIRAAEAATEKIGTYIQQGLFYTLDIT